MKKTFLIVLLVLACMLALAGCSCEHEWTEANCTDAKTCSKCDETEGAPLGHSWLIATCTTAKTCERCNLVEGNALGHSWVEADCVTSKTCSNCGKMEGTPLGHTWMDATTDSPKRCSACDLTEGSRIVTDERFTTTNALPFLGTWTGEIVMTGEDMGLAELEAELVYVVTLVFGNAGDMTVEVAPADIDYFTSVMIDTMVDSLYKELAAEGLSKDAADAAMEDYYGLNVVDYCTTVVMMMDLENLFADLNMTCVYYAEGDKIYSGLTWDSEMDPSDYTLENGELIIEELSVFEDEPLVFTKVEK